LIGKGCKLGGGSLVRGGKGLMGKVTKLKRGWRKVSFGLFREG